MNIRLEKEKVLAIEYNIMNLALKHTKAYITDLVLDFAKLEELNEKGFTGNLIFIARIMGCELGYENDDRVNYFLNPLKENPNQKHTDIKVYSIDLTKLNQLKDVIWCTILYDNELKYDIPYNCIEELYKDQTN